MNQENIIRFPGRKESAPAPSKISEPGSGALGIPGLSVDQEKAMQIILGGTTFICVGIKPTASGADFFTALDGEPSVLRHALPHLDGVIQRAAQKRGLDTNA